MTNIEEVMDKATGVPEKIVDVAFLLPVIGSTIWLGQRNTNPHKRMYGAIGGKTDQQQSLECPFEVRQWKTHLSGAVEYFFERGMIH